MAVVESHTVAVDFADPCPALANTGGFEHPAGRGRGIENAVAMDQQATFEAVAQLGFACAQSLAAEQLAGDAMGLQVGVFGLGQRHLLGVGGDPQRAVVTIGAAFGQVGSHLAPALHGVLAQRQLRRVVVEHQQVAHARRRGIGQAGVEHQHVQAPIRQRLSTGGADDSAADHDDVGHRAFVHGQIPQANGSSRSRIRVVSALICARPRMVGTMRSPSDS